MAKKSKKSADVDSITFDENGVNQEEQIQNDESSAVPAAGETVVDPNDEGSVPKAKKDRKPRASKVYKIAVGKMPEQNQKQLGVHAVVITEAITALVAEGKETASRDEIMAKAVELGLFTRKPSVQGVIPIFSWWRKPLSSLGWLSQNEIEVPAAGVQPQPDEVPDSDEVPASDESSM